MERLSRLTLCAAEAAAYAFVAALYVYALVLYALAGG